MNREILRDCAKVIQRSPQDTAAYRIATFALFHAMSSAHKDVLTQLVHQGPVESGDICSKAGRDDLIELGLASVACVKGKHGFSVANYVGFDTLAWASEGVTRAAPERVNLATDGL